MARPMPREAPEIMTTRPSGFSISSLGGCSAMISEQSLIDTAVIDDVLPRHIAVLRAAQKGDEIAAFLGIGETAGGRAFEAISDDRLVGRVAALGMGMKVGLQRIGIEEARQHTVDH